EFLRSTFLYHPVAVSTGPNHLSVFAIGEDGQLCHFREDSMGFEVLGGVWPGPPAAIARSGNRLNVFIIGTDSALWRKLFDVSN
ncbi:hypothetical protein EDB80DRAFT_593809, partial [Ilyonectria destructans]